MVATNLWSFLGGITLTDGMDLIEKMRILIHLLDEAVHQYSERGKTFASAKCEYQVELAKKMLELRASGHPATIVPDLSRGDTKIAQLRFKKDVAEVVYKSAQEAIQNYKLQIRILESQIEREWKS